RVLFRSTRRHQLANHIDTLSHQIPHRMSVVGANIVALLALIAKVAARLEEKLRNRDITRQLIVRNVTGIGQLRYGAVEPLGKRLHEPTLQRRAALGGQQRQRWNNVQLDLRVVLSSLIKRVHKANRLAKTQWQAKGDVLAYALNNLVYTCICVVEIDSVLPCHHRPSLLEKFNRSDD